MNCHLYNCESLGHLPQAAGYKKWQLSVGTGRAQLTYGADGADRVRYVHVKPVRTPCIYPPIPFQTGMHLSSKKFRYYHNASRQVCTYISIKSANKIEIGTHHTVDFL